MARKCFGLVGSDISPRLVYGLIFNFFIESANPFSVWLTCEKRDFYFDFDENPFSVFISLLFLFKRTD